MSRYIHPLLVDRVRTFLGPRNLRWFRLLKSFHGTVAPVLKLNRNRKHMPVWPVHFREGMQIRNFLRQQPECADWTDHDLCDNWAAVVELAIQP